MRHTRRNGLVILVATGGALALAAGYAHADANAAGGAADSPGVISGNTVQLPVHVPVNICGNTVNVVGLLNPAAGNKCANTGKKDGPQDEDQHHKDSGNGVQLPVDLPVNVSGNSVNVVGLGNAVFGNGSSNTGSKPPTHRHTPPKPPKGDEPAMPPQHDGPAGPPAHAPQTSSTSLADTGSDGGLVGIGAPAAADLILGGALLYRHSRPASARD